MEREIHLGAPFGGLVTENSLRQTLNQLATILPSEYDTSNWCFLPFWFQVKPSGEIIAYHLNQLPEQIKKQIETHREGLIQNLNNPQK